MEEIWKPVPIDGMRSRYEVSNLGNVRRLPYKIKRSNGKSEYILDRPMRYLVKQRSPKGYLFVGLLSESGKMRFFRVHRLVAMAFIPNPNNYPVIDHLDTVVTNNVVSNLRWCTMLENNRNPITRTKRSKTLRAVCVGRKHTEETKRKIAQRRLGSKMPQWVKDKISASLKGRPAPWKRTIKKEEE